MYSPKIPERLIPKLYRLARARQQPMTQLVAEVLDAYLAHLASQHALPVTSPDVTEVESAEGAPREPVGFRPPRRAA